MEALTVALAISAFIFSLLAFVGAATAAVIVIGWSKSTHKVVQIQADPLEETSHVVDLPPGLVDDLPNDPSAPATAQAYVRRVQLQQQALEDLYEPNY